MIDLLVATTNSGKLAEIKAFLKHLPVHIISLNDLKDPPVIAEDGAVVRRKCSQKGANACGVVRLPHIG